MKFSTFLLLTLLLCRDLALASSVNALPVQYVAPDVLRNQIWTLSLPPIASVQHVLVSEPKPDLLCLAPRPVRHHEVAEWGTSVRKQRAPSILTLASILIAIALLLAGYDLIPRAHACTLRFRSIHLKQDLFT